MSQFHRLGLSANPKWAYEKSQPGRNLPSWPSSNRNQLCVRWSRHLREVHSPSLTTPATPQTRSQVVLRSQSSVESENFEPAALFLRLAADLVELKPVKLYD